MYLEVYDDNVVFIMCAFGYLRHMAFRVRCSRDRPMSRCS